MPETDARSASFGLAIMLVESITRRIEDSPVQVKLCFALYQWIILSLTIIISLVKTIPKRTKINTFKVVCQEKLMKTVCEIVVNDVLPTLRAAVAKELIKNYNLNQSEVAKLLDVSQPAVSQYLRQLRGKTEMIENEAVAAHIKDLAGKLNSKQINAEDLCVNMCSIAKVIIDAGLLKDVNGIKKIDTCIVCK